MTVFFDTNILVYAVTTDAKKARAIACLAQGGIASVQVLNEFAHVARRKLRQDWPSVEQVLAQFRAALHAVVPIDLGTHEAALALARNDGLSFWDALIVASAIAADCDTLYSEDLQHARSYGKLTIMNPFAADSA